MSGSPENGPSELIYVSDRQPGFSRQSQDTGFRYLDTTGETLSDEPQVARIKRLAIPPAWTDVWICPDSRGHIQATGRDAKGRKQYRYHPLWTEHRNRTKFDKLVRFAQRLPLLRRRVAEDLASPGLGRNKVSALAVRLLEHTLIRVGNEAYARQNDSYGLTTLRNWHVTVEGTCLNVRFRGKSGKTHTLTECDPRVATLVRRCQELPGQVLLEYFDEAGRVLTLESGDVNHYIGHVMGDGVTAKDFRTWAGTVMALGHLRCLGQRASKKDIAGTVKKVAAALGNTPATCRKFYIHPGVLDAAIKGGVSDGIRRGKRRAAHSGLTPEEINTLAFLLGSR